VFLLNYNNISKSILDNRDYAKLCSLGREYLLELEANPEDAALGKEKFEQFYQKILICAGVFLGQKGQGGSCMGIYRFLYGIIAP
jgi:hypothetical protein